MSEFVQVGLSAPTVPVAKARLMVAVKLGRVNAEQAHFGERAQEGEAVSKFIHIHT